MKKNTLIRSDKPHTVNMAAGSNVAQRKPPAKASAPDEPTQAPPNIQKVTAPKAAKTQRVKAPTPTAKTVRSKAVLTAPTETAPPPGKTKTKPTKAAKPKPKVRSAIPQSAVTVPTAPPIEPLWEKDNPIKARIEQLRTLNAQLAEQLQRLQTTPTARGMRP